MLKPKGKIFISYRREGGVDLAARIYDKLKERGYGLFMDIEDLRSGPFNTALFKQIESASDIIVVLTPHSLDRCANTGDWMRLEIAHALKCGKNVIPVMSRGFSFDGIQLPDDLAQLPFHNGVSASYEYFDASINKLVKRLVANRKSRFVRLAGIAIGLAALVIAINYWLRPHQTETGKQSPIDETANLQAKVEAEAKAAETARLKTEQDRLAADAKAEAKAKADEAARTEAQQERLAAEAKTKAEAEAKIDEMARLKIEQDGLAAEAKADEAARTEAQQERLAAEAKTKAEAEAKAAEVARMKAERGRQGTPAPLGRFVKIDTNTIEDRTRGITWIVVPNIWTFKQAQEQAARRNARLPTVEELESLFTPDTQPLYDGTEVHLDASVFPLMRSWNCWSSKKYFLGRPKYVDFRQATVDTAPSAEENYSVLLIRNP